MSVGNKRIAISPALKSILLECGDPISQNEVAERLRNLSRNSESSSREVQEDDYVGKLLALGILVEEGGDIYNDKGESVIPSSQRTRLQQVKDGLRRLLPIHRLRTPGVPFIVSTPLVSGARVKAISHWLSFMFETRTAAVSIALVVTGHYLYLASPYLSASVTSPWLTVTTAILGVLVGLFLHELGHTAACSRYGTQHGEIGIGLLLILPVFYVNVQRSWSLKRRQRVIVDGAGIYFHLIYSALICFIWLVTHDRAAEIVVRSLLMCTVINAMPFLRFDGYWLATDVIGVPNLREAIGEWWNYVMRRTLNPGASIPLPTVLKLPPVERLLLTCLSFAWLGLAVFLIVRLARLSSLLASTFPSAAASLLREPLGSVLEWEALTPILMATVLILALWSLGRSLVKRGAETIRAVSLARRNGGPR